MWVSFVRTKGEEVDRDLSASSEVNLSQRCGWT